MNTPRRTTNNNGAVIVPVPTILFHTLPEEDAEEMDREPIDDEDNIQLVECAPQQEEETILAFLGQDVLPRFTLVLFTIRLWL